MPVNQTPVNPSSSQVSVLGPPGIDPGAMLMDQAKLLQQGRMADADRQANMQMQREKMAADQAHQERLFGYQKERDAAADAWDREKFQKEQDFRERDATREQDFARSQQDQMLQAQQAEAERQRQFQAEQARIEREADEKRQHDRLEMFHSEINRIYGPQTGMPGMGGGDPLVAGPNPDSSVYAPGGVSATTDLREITRQARSKRQEHANNLKTVEGMKLVSDMIRDGQAEQLADVGEKVQSIISANIEARNAFEARVYGNIRTASLTMNEGLNTSDYAFLKERLIGGHDLMGSPGSLEEASKKSWNPSTGAWELNDKSAPAAYAKWAVTEGGGEAISRFLVESTLEGLTPEPMRPEEKTAVVDLMMAARAAAANPGVETVKNQFNQSLRAYLQIPEDQRSLHIEDLDTLFNVMGDMGKTGGAAFEDFRGQDALDEVAETGKSKEQAADKVDDRITEGMRQLGGVYEVFRGGLSPDELRRVNTAGSMDPRAFQRGMVDMLGEVMVQGDYQTKEQLVNSLVKMGVRGKNPDTGESWAAEIASDLLLGDDARFTAIMNDPQVMRLVPQLIDLIDSERNYGGISPVDMRGGGHEDVYEMGVLNRTVQDEITRYGDLAEQNTQDLFDLEDQLAYTREDQAMNREQQARMAEMLFGLMR